MSKQTAVEWLEQEFIALQNYGVNELGLFAKAKEMEEQQMFNFAIWYSGMEEIKVQKAYERYLIETFKK
jgi:hypothetical protein